MPTRKVSHKRANSTKQTGTVASKRARRQSSTKTTQVKSQHFNHGNSEEEEEETSNVESAEEQASDYEDEDIEESAPSASDEPEESDYSSLAESKKKRSRGQSQKKAGNPSNRGATTKTAAKKTTLSSKDLLRHGVKTGLGPGTQVVIRKPKAREAGSTPYTDDTIHPNTMLFLSDLAANNDRHWLKCEQSDFQVSPTLFSPRAFKWMFPMYSSAQLQRGGGTASRMSLGFL
jgi:hypothetical protein